MKIVLGFLAFIVVFTIANCAGSKHVVCYFESSSVYRLGKGRFTMDDIDLQYCTIVVYTFLQFASDTQRISQTYTLDSELRQFANLRSQKSNLKLFVGIGGSPWSNFSDIVSSAERRAQFITNINDLLMRYKLDGVDIDWQYPAVGDGLPSDKENYVLFLQELKDKFKDNNLILTASVNARASSIQLSYDVPNINKHVDYLKIMAYDFHGHGDRATGSNAPLYGRKGESNAELNVQYSIDQWIAAGASASKLLLGLSFSGRSFKLAKANQNGVGDQTVGAGNKGPYTNEDGYLSYLEICEQQKKGGWDIKWDDSAKTPYASKNLQWIGYDNPESITLKAQYILDKGLAGAAVAFIDLDDYQGICGIKYPLLNAAYKVLVSGVSVDPPTTLTTQEMSQVDANLQCQIRKGKSFSNLLNKCSSKYFTCAKNSNGQYIATAKGCCPLSAFDETLKPNGSCNLRSLMPNC